MLTECWLRPSKKSCWLSYSEEWRWICRIIWRLVITNLPNMFIFVHIREREIFTFFRLRIRYGQVCVMVRITITLFRTSFRMQVSRIATKTLKIAMPNFKTISLAVFLEETLRHGVHQLSTNLSIWHIPPFQLSSIILADKSRTIRNRLTVWRSIILMILWITILIIFRITFHVCWNRCARKRSNVMICLSVLQPI